MARTPSTMLELGTPAPDFRLPDPAGTEVALADLSGKALVVAFLCNHCPFVKHIRAGLARFARDYRERDVSIVAINSNDAESYPEDAPDQMAREIVEAGYLFPYLIDASQAVAKAYHAACTPDFYVFDGTRKLVYRGQFDASRPENGVPVTGADLRAAVDAVLAGRLPEGDQRPSLGCNIKWKGGNAPSYA